MTMGGIWADGLARYAQKRAVGANWQRLGLLLATFEPRDRQNHIRTQATVPPKTSVLRVQASAGWRAAPPRPPVHVYKSWQSAGTGQNDRLPVTAAPFCRRDACR